MTLRLLPMLAVAGQPFDSPEYLFEVKWDGVRALAACDATTWAVWGRDGGDYRDRYPELGILARVPAGTVLDGELVRQGPAGVPTLGAILRRHNLVNPARIAHARRDFPVTYVVFDLLCLRGRSLLAEPLRVRRTALHDLLQNLNEPALCFSEGVVGDGRVLFETVVAQGHEGIMAKHLASRYRPGRRSAAWRKIKPKCRLTPAAAGGE
jgi:ATP-dependent DNA ligase